jgi:ATP-binding cassette subfamily F protein uup
MAPPLLTLRDINLTFGTTPLLNGSELSIYEHDRVCLVGRNGSGKSTLLKIAAGLVEADSGEIFVQPGTTIRYLNQEPDFQDFQTTIDYAQSGCQAGDDPYRVTYLLEQLGLTGEENPKELSGGEGRRAALVRVLAPEPDILLLDEPTNHLDIAVIEWLEVYLKKSRSALVMISHDRRFLENLSQITIWLSLGQTRRLNKGYRDFEIWRDKILELEEVERHKLDRQIVREEHWLRYGVTARRKRNIRRLDNLQNLRQQRRNRRTDTGSLKMAVIEARSSGKLVFEAENISKAFDGKNIIKEFSTRILRGDRIGFIGPNGAGKTTLLKILTSELEPDIGTVRSGAKVDMVSLDQRRESLDDNISLSDALTGGDTDMVFVGDQQRHVVSYMKDFLFQPEQARTAVSALSGGERGRLMLARAFARPSNILILDEPTNDLDHDTLDLLQELISDYSGTILLVSHDRDFLDRVVSATVAPSDDMPGLWIEYAGGYSDMLLQKRDVSKKKPVAIRQRESKYIKPRNKSGRMSFKEKHALEVLPKKIESLKMQISSAQNKMADQNFYKNEIREIEKVAIVLSNNEKKLLELEGQWLELELKREELEET